MTGTLALVGGAEFSDGCAFDTELLEASGGSEVVVVPTASAYEDPAAHVARATEWFSGLGATVVEAPVLRRPDALDEAHASRIRDAAFVYLTDGSPMHAWSVLKSSLVWDALVTGWSNGMVLAGSGAGARVLCDPMVDPRGGAFTVGLGLVEQLAVIPQHDTWSPERRARTLTLAPDGIVIVGVDERTAVIRDGDGWRSAGAGGVEVFVDGHAVGLDRLPA